MKKEKSVAEATSNISSNQQLMNILKNCAENSTNFSTERFVDIPDYLNALEKVPLKTKAKKISIEDAKIIDALIAVLMAMILKAESTKKSKKTKKK
jgi:hypothetical protein